MQRSALVCICLFSQTQIFKINNILQISSSQMENFETNKLKSDSPQVQKTQQLPQSTTSDPRIPDSKTNQQQVAFSAHLPEKPLQTTPISSNNSTESSAAQQPAGIFRADGQYFYAPIQHISLLALQNYNFYFYQQPYNFSSLPNAATIPPFVPRFQEISKQEREKPPQRKKRSLRKELQSAKKNSECNIINQLYSHLASTQRSEKIVDKIIRRLGLSSVDNSKKAFYGVARAINLRRGRKYVNKESILAFYRPQGCIEQFGELAAQLDRKGDLTLHNFCRIFRMCTFHFLREEITTAVLTSKRIEGVAGLQHLRRRRIILDAMQVALQ